MNRRVQDAFPGRLDGRELDHRLAGIGQAVDLGVTTRLIDPSCEAMKCGTAPPANASPWPTKRPAKKSPASSASGARDRP